MTMTFLDLLLIGPVFLIALLSLFMMVKQSAKNFLNKYVMQSILVAVAVLGLFFS